MAQTLVDPWTQQQDYYGAQWNYGQAQQWQPGNYEGQAPGAEEPAVPGQEAEVPPGPPPDPQYPSQAAYQGWSGAQAQAQPQDAQQQHADAWQQWHQQQQQSQGYAQPQQHYQQAPAPELAGHYAGYTYPGTQPHPLQTAAPHQAHAAPHTPPAPAAVHHQAPHAGYTPMQQPQQPQQRHLPHLHQQPLQGVVPGPASAQRPAAAQSGRPLAQSGADVGFRVKVKMPRSTAGRPSAAGPVSQSPARAAGTTQFVPVVTTAARTAAPATAPGGSAAAGSAGWPESLRAYVTRCLKEVMADKEHSIRMHIALKAVISQADTAGERWTRDWDTEPTPSLEPDEPAASRAGTPGTSAGVSAGTPSQEHWTQRGTPQDGPLPKGKRARAMAKAERKRQKRFGTPSSSPDHAEVAVDERANRERHARFGDGSVQGGRTMTQEVRQRRRSQIATVAQAGAAEDQRWDDFVIRGTCQQLEKSYFRLTAAPDPADVRPEPVLRRALNRVVGLLAAAQPVKYLYALDQFKGMRQDLTVQHMGGQIAVDIYEAAARAALEHGDLPEYHQCQARLDTLHAQGVGGCRIEFLAYRILYQVAHSAQAGGAAALLSTLRLVDTQAAAHPAVAHAMRVRTLAGRADAPGLCGLYAAAPGLGRALLDLMLPRARFSALKTLAGAYMAPLPVALLAGLLGFCARGASVRSVQQLFEADEGRRVLPGCTRRVFLGKFSPAEDYASGTEQCRQWLLAHGAVLAPSPPGSGELHMDCKASRGQLAVPEDTSAVAHGDVNIDVTDFLKNVLQGA